MFSAYIHHYSLCVILVSQNLFVNDTLFRELNKNVITIMIATVQNNFIFQASYYLIFDNVRSRGSLRSLSRILFDKSKFLTDVLEQERKNNKFAHIILDLCVGQSEIVRVRVGWPFLGEVFAFAPE